MPMRQDISQTQASLSTKREAARGEQVNQIASWTHAGMLLRGRDIRVMFGKIK